MNMTSSLCKSRTIVMIDTLNKLSIRMLEYASTISNHIVVFNISDDQEQDEELRQSYALLNTDIPLYIEHYSNSKDIVDILLDFIGSEEYGCRGDESIIFVVGEIIVEMPWLKILHNGTGKYIEKRLSQQDNIKVARVPFRYKGSSKFSIPHPKFAHF